jgi:hypothetical protein
MYGCKLLTADPLPLLLVVPEIVNEFIDKLVLALAP